MEIGSIAVDSTAGISDRISRSVFRCAEAAEVQRLGRDLQLNSGTRDACSAPDSGVKDRKSLASIEWFKKPGGDPSDSVFKIERASLRTPVSVERQVVVRSTKARERH